MGKYHKGIRIEGAEEFLLAVNITGQGAPTEDTEAEPGMCYLDEDSENGDLYKCIGVLVTEEGKAYQWKKLADQDDVDLLSEAIADLKENGTVPENVALLEDVTVSEASGDFIPMLSPNGTEYRLSIGNDGIPVIMDGNGNTVWSGTSGGTGGETPDDGGETPDDGGEGGDTPDTGANWTDGVPYTLANITTQHYVNSNTGELVYENSDYAATDYLYVYGAEWIHIPGDCRYSALYDINKNYVGKIGGSYGGYYVVPDEAVYIRVSGAWLTESSEIVPYADVEATWSDGVACDLGSLVENTYIESGAEKAYNGWSATDYINCAHANNIVFSGFIPNNVYTGFYDAKRKWTGTIVHTDGVVGVPTGVCYFRVSGSDADMAKLVVTPHAQ